MHRWCLIGLSLLWVEPSFAHGDIPGVDGFYAGILHPLVTPAHLLILLSCGLLISQRGRSTGQHILGCLLPGLLLGILIGWLLPAPAPVLASVGVILGTLLGLSLALEWPRQQQVLKALALGSGVLIGADSLPGRQWPEDAIILLGTGVGALLVVCVIAGALLDLQKPWQRIGLRVAGAWISAACILVLALQLARL